MSYRRYLIEGFTWGSLFGVAVMLLLAVLLVGCASPPALRTVAQQRAAAVEVAVACGVRDTEAWYLQVGSGVIVDAKHVLTARHVVACDVQAVLVVTARGQQITADVEIIAPQHDIARLELDEAVGTAPPVVGPVREWSALCMVVAYPRRARVCGPVSQKRGTKMQDVGFSATSVAGNSGSGLYDLAGRLVGIVTHKCRSEGCTYATSLEKRAWILVTP